MLLTRRIALRTVLCVVLSTAGADLAAQTAADSAWDSGDLQTAERLYRARLAVDSTDERALQRVALILAWGEDYERSLALYDRLIMLAPEHVDAKIQRARVIAWRGDPSAAARALDAVLAERPTYVPALKARAQFLSWAGEYADALAIYDRIIEITPDDVTARRDQARVLTWDGRHEDAVAIYERILADEPGDQGALLGLGLLLSWSDRLDSAEVVFERVLRDDPGNLEAVRAHARTAAWGGRLIEAEARWRRALQQHPDDVESLVGLAATLRWQGRNAAAQEAVDRALELSPNDADARTQRDWARSATSPRVGTNFTYEADSENNRMYTMRLRSAWRPLPRTEMRVEAYRREADVIGANRIDHYSIGARVTSWWQFEPGWSVQGGLGVAESQVAGTKPTLTLSGAASTPGRHRVVGTASYVRAPVEATAAIIRNDVHYDQVGLAVTTKLTGTLNLFANGTWAQFRGTEKNRRLAGSMALSWRLSRMWTIGTAGRAFGFQKDLTDGYFDPNFYGLLESSVRWRKEWGEWLTQVEVAPGLQKVRTGGPIRGAVRTLVRVGYSVAPGRDLTVSGGYSSSGLRIPSGNADYRYWSLGLGANWRF